MILNILDQSPVSQNAGSSEALARSIELAKLGDELGYKRYWIAEHHSTRAFASASPEIFIPRVASLTGKIRVGSGGVMISHYAPFKIAEQFSMLEALFPGRIDLGLGRAPGGDANILRVLRTPRDDAFAKVDEVINFLKASSENRITDHVIASPSGNDMPEVWVLGTSPDSAMHAARQGLRYSFGAFINDEYMLKCFEIYYQNFKPSVFLKEPYLNLALFVISAETEEDAQRMAKGSEYWLARTFLRGINEPFPDEKTALNYKFTTEERMLIDYRRRSALIGTAKEVAEKISQLMKKYAVHEFTAVTITSNHEDRLNSYRLLANELL